PLIPVIAARYFGASWNVIFPIYSVALVITSALLWPMQVEERRSPDHRPTTFGSALGLLKNGYVAMMVLALFLYVVAEVSVSSGIPLYLKERFEIDINRIGLLGTGLFFMALTIGRFSGGVILTWIKAKPFFTATCALSILGLLGVFAPSPTLAVASFF